MKHKGYIYKYSFPNGKVYIGQTITSVKQRHYVHMSDARRRERSTLCDVALAKFGEIQPETIEIVEDEDKTKLKERLDKAEIKWIRHYDSTNIVNGYNVQQGGKITSEDTMILEEKWYEIYDKEKWGEFLSSLRYCLKSIGKKLYVTKERLSKEERYAWYSYRFEFEGNPKMSFSKLYNEYNGFEGGESLGSYNEIVLEWGWNEYLKDVRQTIWRKVNKHKDRYIREYWADAKIKRI